MKGLIAFSIISLLAGSQNIAKDAENLFQQHGRSQEEIHESVNAKLHEREPWDEGTPEANETPEASETPEATVNPTATPTATASPTETPTGSPTETATPAETPTATPTETPTGSPTVTAGVNLGTGTLQDLLNQIIKFFQSLGH